MSLNTTRLGAYDACRAAAFNQSNYDEAIATCLFTHNPYSSTSHPPLIPSTQSTDSCPSGTHYTAQAGDDCNSIALRVSVSSAGLLDVNKDLHTCASVSPGMDLCLPLPCTTYALRDGETSWELFRSHNILPEHLRLYNPFIDLNNPNFIADSSPVGYVICLDPPAAGYSTTLAMPPDDAPVMPRTTRNCGVWYVAQTGDTHHALAAAAKGLSLDVLLQSNHALVRHKTDKLVVGAAYCVSPLRKWNSIVSFPYRQFGCYELLPLESGEYPPRVLYDDSSRSERMTVEMCAEDCLLWGHRYFGLIGGSRCFCDHILRPGSRRVSDARCNVPCVGNETQSCGGSLGSNAMDVWGLPGDVVVDTFSACGWYDCF